MELALSLGDSSKPFKFIDKTPKLSNNKRDLGGFRMGIELDTSIINNNNKDGERSSRVSSSSSDHEHNPPLLQLHLLPSSSSSLRHPSHSSPHLPFPWISRNVDVDGPVVSDHGLAADRSGEKTEEGAGGVARSSSPKSATSSIRLDFGINMSSSGGKRGKRDHETERASSRGSDDEENGLARKKLRLSKEQSAFLEESFKEHSTLNPKQKLELAKQLNLRPRQVEVWFQNRRARTKLKQTEVDYEYLKRCCETLTEENRRLQKEVQELRALKTSQPFFMNLPATTLTMCPSCERVSSTSTSTTTTTPATTATTNPTVLSL